MNDFEAKLLAEARQAELRAYAERERLARSFPTAPWWRRLAVALTHRAAARNARTVNLRPCPGTRK